MQVVKIALGVALLGLSVSEARACADLVSFDRTARLSVDEIGRAAAAGRKEVGDRYLAFDSFRIDGRPVRGGRTALAIAGAGGETGEPTFFGVLWTSRPELFGANALVVVPAPLGGSALELTAAGACGKVWRLELTPQGLVSVNGRKAAEIAP